MRIHNTAILYTQKGTRNNYCRLFIKVAVSSIMDLNACVNS